MLLFFYYRKSAKSQLTMAEGMLASAKLQMKSAESQVTSSKKELDDAQDFLKGLVEWVDICIYYFDIVFS